MIVKISQMIAKVACYDFPEVDEDACDRSFIGGGSYWATRFRQIEHKTHVLSACGNFEISLSLNGRKSAVLLFAISIQREYRLYIKNRKKPKCFMYFFNTYDMERYPRKDQNTFEIIVDACSFSSGFLDPKLMFEIWLK